MNLSILLSDFIDTKGVLKTYRFIPINLNNRIVVDRLSDICTDVKENTDRDIGLLRIYNSDKCQLISTTCKIKDFKCEDSKISFSFEHMFIPVESSRYGSCGIYNFILPVNYRLTELHIVDPFDNGNKLKDKKHFKYDVFYDGESHIQIVQMQLRSARGSFSFILKGKASIDDDENKFIDYKEQRICLDEEIQTFYFDEGIKKSFWKNLKESILLEPNFNGMGIDLKKLLKSLRK